MTSIKGHWNPSQYEKFKDERSQPFLDLMGLIEPVEHSKVVDLGCGTGELTQLLHRHLTPLSTLGIDTSKEMLKKSEEYRTSSLSFEKADIETWTPSEKFDVIFSNAALQWCGNHEQLFAHLYEALKTHGQLAVQMPMNHDYPTHVLAQKISNEPKWNKLLNGEAYDKYSALLSPEDYAALLFKLGFREQNVNLKVYGHVLESRAGVVEWVKGSMLTYFKSRLSETDYNDFVKEFQERLFKILPNEKPFFYPFKRVLLWARK
ncbi:MAG: methyltransferase domain-containing protein [Rhizobacter sp.]|nr:methyltransferase domain-containing protein [Bacteriovorax sp.]